MGVITKTQQIAAFQERINIQTATNTADSYGAFSQSWATTYTRWAKIMPMTGTETAEAARLEGKAHYRVIIRYLSGVTEKQRVIWGSKTLEIVSPPIHRGKQYTEFLCKELT